ncbi:hypothetical protein [Streptomyces alfalfae]|uniref:hypothetical protein n=1 Tax=Streptomyces alfalfae TaxID=1642299 RepID=UPI003AAECBCF
MTSTDSGPTHVPTGHRRRTLVMVPASAESVTRGTRRTSQAPQAELPQQQRQSRPSRQPQQTYRAMYPQAQHIAYQPPPVVPQPPQPHLQDPPIYRALIRIWADRDRTLPGRHDPEWCMLTAPREAFSGSRDPRGDAR